MARPRGYAPWDPKPDTVALIGAVLETTVGEDDEEGDD